MSNILDRAARMLADNRKLRRWCIAAGALAVVLVATVSALLVGNANALAGGDTLRNAITGDSALFWEPVDGAESDWQAVDPNTPVDPAAKLRLRIAFELPAGTLSNGATLQYRLPDGLTLPNTAADESDALAVYDAQTVGAPSEKSAARIGTATVKDGIVTVRTFDDAADADGGAVDASDSSTSQTDEQSADASANEEPVAGFVDFDFDFDALNLDSDGYAKLALNDAQSLAVAKQITSAPEDSVKDSSTSASAEAAAPVEEGRVQADSEGNSNTTASTAGVSTGADNDSDEKASAGHDAGSLNNVSVTATQVTTRTLEDSLMRLSSPRKSLVAPLSAAGADGGAKDGIDFGKWLTSVVIKKNGQSSASTEFNDGDMVNAHLEYSIPKDTITSANRTITYKLPGGIKPIEASSGRATDNQSKEIGDYSIDTDGIITITFDKSFVESGNAIDGSVDFQGKISASETDKDGTIHFGGAATDITVIKPVEEKYDISTSKTGTKNADGKTATYTVTVSSTKGTGDKVSIEDKIDKNQSRNVNPEYDQSNFKIVKVDASGTQTDVTGHTPEFSSENDSISFAISDLPALKANEKYVVTYNVNINPDQNSGDGGWKLANAATGKRGNTPSSGWCTLEKVGVIEKTGEYKSDTGLIHWKITVNKNGENDVSGWTAKDTLPDGCTLMGNYMVYGQQDGQWQALTKTEGTTGDKSISYTFPKNLKNPKQPYIIEFDTTAPETNGTVSNTGKVNTGDHKYSSTTDVGVTHRDYQVKKEFKDESVKLNIHTLRWKADVQLPDKQLTDFAYEDVLSNVYDGDGNDIHYTYAGKLEEYFSKYLYLKVNDNVKYEYKGAGKKVYKEDASNTGSSGDSDDLTMTITYYDASGNKVEPTDFSTKVKSFMIQLEFAGGHKVFGQHLMIDEYGTYLDDTNIPAGTSLTVKNTATVNGKTSEASKTIEKPKIFEKQVYTGKDSGNASKYKHGDTTVDYDEREGVLKYRLMLYTTSDDEGTITITDVLPKGETLVGGSSPVSATFFDSEYYSTQDNYKGTKFVDGSNPTYKTNPNNDGTTTLTITIPDYKYSKDLPKIAVTYSVSVASDPDWNNPDATNKTYSNTATWGSNKSTQNTTVKRAARSVAKTGVQLDKNGNPIKDETSNAVASNKVRYYVDINPAGKDLNPKENTLTLTDAMQDVDKYSPQLDVSSIKLYAYDITKEHHIDEKKVISEDRYSVKYDQKNAKVTVTVPDNLACVLVYDYQLDKDAITSGAQVKNNCSLDGTWSSDSQLNLKEIKSGASAVHKQIVLYKVDEDHFQQPIDGAKFTLEYWDSKKWVMKDSQVAPINGVKTWDVSGSSPELDSNKLYRLIETQAPDGYALDGTPHYFIWMDKWDDKNASYNASGANSATKPDNTTGISQNDVTIFKNVGGLLYASNKYARLTVKKQWAHEDGSTAAAPSGANATLQLRRYVRTDDPDKTCKVHIHAEGTKLPEYNWWSEEKDITTLSIKRGSSLTLKISMGWDVPMKALIDGSEYSSFNVTGGSYTLTIDATKLAGETADVDLVVTSVGNAPTNVEVTDFTKPDAKDSKHEVVEEFTFSDSAGWTKNFEDLQESDTSGNEYHYEVIETGSNVAATPLYTNNDGIQTGTITVTNTLAEGYELPKTGGSGTVRYTTAGAMIVAVAMAFLARRKWLRERD